MALLSLNLPIFTQGLSKAPALPPSPLRLSFPKVDRGLVPLEGLFCSFLTHSIVIFAVLFLPIYLTGQVRTQDPDAAELSAADHVIYLPKLGGGSEANGKKGGGSVIHRKGSAATPARSSQGLSYPGPQAILSNPPNPTNHIQTILQPGIKNPTVLKPLIPLPNIVHTANAAPIPSLTEPVKLVAPTVEDLKPKTPSNIKIADVVAPVLLDPTNKQIDPLKLSLPASALQRPDVPEMTAPHARAKPINEDNKSTGTQYSPVPTRGTDLQNLLVLSPTPTPPQQSVSVPAGESRGQFGISPQPNPAASQSGPGSKTVGAASLAPGIGDQSEASVGNSAATGDAGVSDGAVRLAIGGSGGMGIGTGKIGGSGNGGGGNDIGRGSASGVGTGEGPGLSPGAGKGAGAGSGAGAFPGITIQGGSVDIGASTSIVPHADAAIAPRTSYGMTIVSTANSGGGLGDYGVFSHEQVYTVYVDMRRSAQDRSVSWTLQCAVVDRGNGEAGTTPGPGAAQEGFVPPFPVAKEQPRLPEDLVRRYTPRMMVVYAIINAEGKLEQISVKDTPDSQLNRPLVDALGKWMFRPAEFNGQPVKVKILLGIPLTPSE